jgi:hypothetical protein
MPSTPSKGGQHQQPQYGYDYLYEQKHGTSSAKPEQVEPKKGASRSLMKDPRKAGRKGAMQQGQKQSETADSAATPQSQSNQQGHKHH